MNNYALKLLVGLQTLVASEDGQDLVEYALIVALVAFGATAAMQSLGSALATAFNNISTTLSSSLA